jgi:hypothetical protein
VSRALWASRLNPEILLSKEVRWMEAILAFLGISTLNSIGVRLKISIDLIVFIRTSTW